MFDFRTLIGIFRFSLLSLTTWINWLVATFVLEPHSSNVSTHSIIATNEQLTRYILVKCWWVRSNIPGGCWEQQMPFLGFKRTGISKEDICFLYWGILYDCLEARENEFLASVPWSPTFVSVTLQLVIAHRSRKWICIHPSCRGNAEWGTQQRTIADEAESML